MLQQFLFNLKHINYIQQFQAQIMISTAAAIQKHKHCKQNCVSHNSFAVSLRKYDSSLQTTKCKYSNLSSSKSHHQSKQITQSIIKPFKPVAQAQLTKNIPQKQRQLKNTTTSKNQIQSYLMKVSLPQQLKRTNNLGSNIINTNNATCDKNKIKQQKQQAIQQRKEMLVSKQQQRVTFQQVNDLETKEYQKIVTVTSKQFDSLQFNADRISKIIECFNKKISHHSNSPSISNLSKELPAKQEAQNYKANPIEITKIIQNNIVQKNKENDNFKQLINENNVSSSRSHKFPLAHSEKKKNKKQSLINKQNAQQIEVEKPQRMIFQSRKLNYKMFNCSSKGNFTSNLSISRRIKCHGGPSI